MGLSGAQPHALVIPVPHQGHWNPFKIFIRQLLNMNISVTVFSTPHRISELQQWKNNGEVERLQHLELVEAFPDLPKKRFLNTVKTSEQMKVQFWEEPALKEKLLAQKSAGNGPTFLVADMFLYWTQDVADQLAIPRYTFFTSPTTFALAVFHISALQANDYNPELTSKRDEIVNLPGLETFRVADMFKEIFLFPKLYISHSKNLTQATGILINSFEPYEAGEVAALRACLEKGAGTAKVPSVHLIGPLQNLPIKPVGHSRKDLTAETDDSGCLRFLGTQPPASVVYICFGSQVPLGAAAMTELAQGLELTEVPFLWILLPPAQKSVEPTGTVSDLPDGFIARTKGRGLVCTEWAPQKEILEHPSTGGFISHCGWNSLVETISAGVAVIPWPIRAEQFMNARFVAEVLKVAAKIKPSPDGRFLGEEVAKTVRLLMNSDEGKETKLKMKDLQRSLELAVEDGGSSNKALRAFQEEISSLSN